MIRALEAGGIRLVLQIRDLALLEALDELLPSQRLPETPRPLEKVELEVSAGTPTALIDNGRRLVADVHAGELPAALRLLMGSVLERRGGAILHGAAIALDSQAVLCIAPSEGGKTTLCGKIAGRLPVLSDETIALRLDGSVPRISGTPFWSGPALPTATGLFPLAAICFLRKGGVGLKPKAKSEALMELLREWHLADRPGASGEALTKADTLLARVPIFDLHSTLESDPLLLLQQAASAGLRPAS